MMFTFLAVTVTLRAQGPLTTLESVQALAPAEAAAGSPVKVRAYHLAPSRYAARALLMQDGRAVSSVFAGLSEMPPANVELEVTGITRRASFRGAEETVIEVQGAQILARDVTPEPLRVPPEEIYNGKHRDRWVETEGTVLQMHLRNGDLLVSISGESGFLNFFCRGIAQTALPDGWLHGRLRVRGVALGGTGETRLAVHGQMNASLLTRGEVDAFSCPEAKAADLLRAAKGIGERVRFTATVLREADNRQWLRAADGTAALSFFHGAWKPDTAAPHLTSPVPDIPPLHPGDVVEVVCSPFSDGAGLLLRYCHMRVLRSDGDISPRPADAAAIARGVLRNDLVTVTGRAASQGTLTLQPGQQYEGVRLTAGGAELEVYYQSPDGGKLARLSPDDLIEATGIAVAGGTPGTGRLMLRSPTDLRSLGTAPEVLRLRQWRIIGIGAGVALLAGGIILLLRRRLVKERTLAGEVRALNATLETRVAERTAELEKAREELKAALKEEREVGELKSRFVSTVSHEFRTPLGVIMSATDIIARYRDRLTPERLDEHLTEISHATRHMSGMMEDILLLGKSDAGRVPVAPQPVDLPELCHRLADETRSAVHQTGTTLITTDPLPGPALLDEMIFRHLFTNLLSNAVKYSPDHAVVKVHLGADGERAIVTITDHGIGIPPEDAPRLFQPFARGGNVEDRPGTGLGLVVVKRCAELLGGDVTFASTPGQGTTFTVTLPVWMKM